MKALARRLLSVHPPLLEWARNLLAVARGRRVGADRFLRFEAPRHYYSPLPHEAAWRAARRTVSPFDGLPGLDLRLEEQKTLFQQLAPRLMLFAPPIEPSPNRRYYKVTSTFSPATRVSRRRCWPRIAPAG